MFLIRSLITNKLRPYWKAHSSDSQGELGFPVYGSLGLVASEKYALQQSQGWPVFQGQESCSQIWEAGGCTQVAGESSGLHTCGKQRPLFQVREWELDELDCSVFREIHGSYPTSRPLDLCKKLETTAML